MVDVSGVAVSQGAEKLKCQPLLFDILEKRTGAYSIIKGAVEELANEIPVGLRFDDALESKGVGNLSKSLSLFYPIPAISYLVKLK